MNLVTRDAYSFEELEVGMEASFARTVAAADIIAFADITGDRNPVHVADQAERVANHMAEQGRDAGERVQEVAGNFKGAVDRSVKDQPMATLVMAAVIGFVLDVLWKS